MARDCSPRAKVMPAVQAPERRQLRVGDALPERVGRAAERGGRLGEVVLEQPGFGQRGPDRQLVFAIERARIAAGASSWATPPRPGRARARAFARASVGWTRGGRPRQEYTKYTS